MSEPAQVPKMMHEYTVLLRAVSTPVSAAGMLYVAAGLLTPGRNQTGRAVNRAIVDMVAVLLDLPTTEPELVERVLRNLPDPDRGVSRNAHR